MKAAEIRDVQRLLTALGHYTGPIDALFGSNSRAGLAAALAAHEPSRPDPAPARPLAALPRFDPPTRAQATAVFGQPGSAAATAGRCRLPFAMPLAWDMAQQITSFACHAQLSEVMTAVYAEAVRHHGETEFRRLRLDRFGGCFNNRNVRGSTTTISIHAFGAAVDTDPERNGLHTPTAQAALARPEFADWWRIVEATGGRALGKRINRDWMHWSYVQE